MSPPGTPGPISAENSLNERVKLVASWPIDEPIEVASGQPLPAQLGLGITHPGYNIYVAGIEGTGKTSVINEKHEVI